MRHKIFASLWVNLLRLGRSWQWLEIGLGAIVATLASFHFLGLRTLYLVNQWDILLQVGDYAVWTIWIFPMIFGFLILTRLGQSSARWSALLDVWGGSRFAQWCGQVLAVIVAALFTTIGVFVIVGVIALCRVPLASSWSPWVYVSHWHYVGGLTWWWIPVSPLIVYGLMILLWVGGLSLVGVFLLKRS